ncbi:DUF948 domain-containing protein [Acidaminobacter sp. JC074]|uniref:DUF948 domain-containing protein n=1 Tax=Acidaminobacter sp. JC074 TaxID=2530199 RepID=UPI001F106BBC|nr:DUF948 domain-containing protein [Acidaminobacter sp. JC074]
MDTIITFTLKDLLVCGVYIALIVMIIYIIKILMKLHSSMKHINAVVEDNRKEIDAILKEAPGISQNVNTISEEVAHDITQFRGTVDNIAETTESVTEVVKENQSVVDGLTSIFHTASIAKGAYDKFFTKESNETVNEEE